MSDLTTLWLAVRSAGSVDNYVRQQLEAKGFLVKRRPTDGMSPKELEKYKQELKREAAEARSLRAAAWKAHKANHIVHVGEGVYWNDADDLDRFDVPQPEERQAENGLPPLDSPKKLAEALGLSIIELRWLSWHRDLATGVHYRRFTIPKRSGGERAIWAPMPKLKKAQRWILREIVEKLPVHGAAHGFLAGRSIATNAAAHNGALVVLKLDLKDFFPTLTLPRVKGLFRRAGYREQVATLLALLCTESPREIVEQDGKRLFVALGPRCLPQGAPTSPAITNAVCMRLDRRLAGAAAKLGWRYTRYADDLTFSRVRPAEAPVVEAAPAAKPAKGKKAAAAAETTPAPSQAPAARLSKLLGVVHEVVKDEGFIVHPDKTRVARSGGRQAVTGLIINGDQGPRPPRELRRRVRAALHHLAQGKALPEGETVERVAGLIAYIRMTMPQEGERLYAELQKVTGAAASA
ncbi:reverse transcriptase family protein [Myxococcota bacterium]|jgi:RNA-directed DNA polymerase|nr:reverse transcriptase family protein [Myxococcota bacterium]